MKRRILKIWLEILVVAFLVVLSLLFFACSKAAPIEGVNIMYFVSEPKTVSTYGTATLSWSVQRGLLVMLSGGGTSMVVAETGTLDIVPGEETIYTLHAVGPNDTVGERQLTVKIDRTSPCGSLQIGNSTGFHNRMEVEVGPNPHPYYSAKNVIVEVKLFNDAGTVIETGTGIIAEIPPGKYGKAVVYLSKASKQARSEYSIIGCDCDYTEPK